MNPPDPEDVVDAMLDGMRLRELENQKYSASMIADLERRLAEERLDLLASKARLVIIERELEHHKRHG